MGSENSALKRDALEEPPFTLPSGVNIYPAVLQRGKLASVFVYQRENEDNVNKAAKHLKTLRHPCLLRFLSCTVETDGIHLVTERVQPLEKVLPTLASLEICAGVYDVLQALVFLHERGNLTHNNVCLSSTFVSEDGHWKLGGMETVCKQNEATAEFLHNMTLMRDKECVPPEELATDFRILPVGQGHARDAYSFGAMVENLLTYLNEDVAEDVLASFQHTLRSAFLNPDPTCRPPLSSLLPHEFFKNDFLEVVSFLNSLTLKTEEEKTAFFKFLLDRVVGLSEELIALRLVPLLLNQLVFAEPVAVKSFFPHLLGPKKDKVGESQITGLLSPAMFQVHISPVLLKLFEVHEEHVRMVLLSHLDAYAELFSQKELKSIILPQVLLGLRDTNDSLVAVTLQSLGVLVSLLGPDVVVGGDRTKIFKSSAPSFTKPLDRTPEGSPIHILKCQKMVICESLQKDSSMFKFPNSRSLPFSNKAPHVPRQDCHMTFKKVGQDPAASLNGLSGGFNVFRNGGSCQHVAEQMAEEWPDWNECEATDGNATVRSQRKDLCAAASPSLPNGNVMEEAWENVAHGSTFMLFSGKGPSAEGSEDLAELQLHPDRFELQQEFRTLKLNSSVGPPSSDSEDDIAKLPVASCPDRSAKLECGLGEEFTIQVKKKEGHDVEQDWFADMVPDIKAPSALLIRPDLEAHPMAPSDSSSSSVHDAQKGRFSSKFAVAEVTEVTGIGWEEEDLNWEEDANW